MSDNTVHCGSYSPCYAVFSRESVAEDGVVLKKKAIKVVNNAEFMAQYSPDDFRIENLEAVGAMQDMKRYTYSPSTIDMMDSVGDALDVVADIYDNNNVEKNEE